MIPNPNNGSFVVALDNAGGLKIQVSVLNSLGQLVYEGAEFTTNLTSIDISALASGIYYLQVNTAEEMFVKKVVKE